MVAEGRTDQQSAARGRLETAKDIAWQQIAQSLKDREMPALIRELLERSWQNVLMLTHLRSGPGSQDWLDRVEFIDDFIWSGQPKKTAADVARLQSMLPKLSEQLRVGLEMVAFPLEDIQAIFADLKVAYQEQLEERYRHQLHIPSVRSSAHLRRISHLQPIKIPEVEKSPEPGSDEAVRQRIRKEIQALERGTWLEFTTTDGTKVRAKLSWRSPMSGNLLFVSAQGLKLVDKPEDELVDEIATGETMILDSQPVFNFGTRRAPPEPPE